MHRLTINEIFPSYRLHRLSAHAFATGIFLMLMCMSLLARASSPTSLITSSAWWQDPTGQATLEQAKTQTYTPYEGIFNQGYSDATHWLRLTLNASDQSIGLRITPPWLDEITLYDPALADHPFRAGDRHPVGRNVRMSLGYTLLLPPSPQPRLLWIQLKSTSAHRLEVNALPLEQMLVANTPSFFGTAMYATSILLLLISLISVWWRRPEYLLGVYLVRYALHTVLSFIFLGLPGLLLPESIVSSSFLDITFSLTVLTTIPVSLWFEVNLLKTYRPQRHLLLGLQFIAWISLLPLGMMLAGHTRLGLETTAQSAMVVACLVFLTALSTQPEKSVDQLMPRHIMLAYYLVVLGCVLVGQLSILGWIRPSSWVEHLQLVYGLVSSSAMAIILLVRSQRMKLLHQQTALQLQKAQQDVQLEQKRSQEQSQFLHMLMHELKTPLSVVSAALGTKNHREENLLHAGRAVQDMKAIIDRCVQADQMGALTLRQDHNTIELPAWITSVTDNIARLASRLQLQTDITRLSLTSDAQLLQIVLTNLLDNASRYSDPLTPVTVQLTRSERSGRNGVEIHVRNTPGLAGWPDEHLLFSKYYRASGAQRDSGSGLGLYLSRQLTNSLGGTLDYVPTSQQVEFILWIPQTPA